MAREHESMIEIASKTYLSPDAIRRLDEIAIQEWLIPGMVLMENAAIGCVEELRRIAQPRTTVCILCGAGNNAGDGFAIARHLDAADFKVVIVTLPAIGTRLQGDAKINFDIAVRSQLRILELTTPEDAQKIERAIEEADVIVDAMLGTGASGSPREPLNRWIELANRSSAFRFAVDLPSGLDAATGICHEPTFLAHLTCTFVAQKTGFQSDSAADALGTVKVIGIGLPKDLWREALGVAAG